MVAILVTNFPLDTDLISVVSYLQRAWGRSNTKSNTDHSTSKSNDADDISNDTDGMFCWKVKSVDPQIESSSASALVELRNVSGGSATTIMEQFGAVSKRVQQIQSTPYYRYNEDDPDDGTITLARSLNAQALYMHSSADESNNSIGNNYGKIPRK